jgi:hypothetical protein
MIDTIKVAGLRNNDYSQFLQNILSVIDRFDPDKLMSQEEYDNLLARSAAIKSALNKKQGSDLTDELVALDDRRDEAVDAIAAIINSFSYHKDAAVKAAAGLLNNHLDSFGPSLTRQSLQNETSKIQKMVQGWNEKPELKAAVSLLGLDSWKAELEAANTAFDKLYVDRSVQKGDTAGEDNMFKKRTKATAAWYELRDHLEAWYTIKKKADPWATAITALNGVIKDYNSLLAGRGSKDGDDKSAGSGKLAA